MVIARVGESAITREDVRFRRAMLAVRSGTDATAPQALVQLLEEAMMREVGRAHGVAVTAADLATEAARVSATSRDPATLARIRAVFGGDEGAYRRLVLEPVLVNQRLYAAFDASREIQAAPLARARELLAAALAPGAPLAALATRYGAELRTFDIAGGQVRPLDAPAGTRPSFPAALPGGVPDRDALTALLAGLAVGKVHPEVVEERGGFMVVRLLRRDGDRARLEAAVVAKLPFDPWFESAARAVPVRFEDAKAAAELRGVALPRYLAERLRQP
ncbi:MAG TPA: hypothetical protein VLW17_00510 [Thermoanaerobaculaceae bacterium]|nr:hypothetical protein [Thermoanaerobaculaceae bacterium]